MSDSEPIAFTNGVDQRQGHRVNTARKWTGSISFNRRELSQILSVYGRKVAEGEWRDYAIDMRNDRAIFSIFRRTSEVPLYRIEKDPKLARRQGAFSVVSASGHILRRGHHLENVIRVLEGKPRLIKA